MTRILIPSGALGLGYDAEALDRGIAAGPDIIAIDGGSTDSGPSYLGRGVSKYARSSTKAEWKGLVAARARAGCPLVIGTAGTCGTDSMVDWMADITRECLTELGLSARIATLKCEQAPAAMAAALREGRITPLPAAPEVDAEGVAACSHIVALAGTEQIAAALETGAEIVIAGRTTDTAIIAALPLMRGDHAGAAWHGAKVGECGALCATHPQTGVLQLDIDATGFTVAPLAPQAACTPQTVAAHMLYENSDPFILYEPGGHLDVTRATYTPQDSRTVRVEGAEWVPAPAYMVKLEGARRAGFQTILLTLVRDGRYVANIRDWCAQIEERHAARVAARMGLNAGDYRLELRLIGVDATLGPLETAAPAAAEVGVLAIVTAATQEAAQDIAKLLNPLVLHHPLTPQEDQPTFAFPFSPPEIDRGAAWEFCLNHVLRLDDPMSAFRLEVHDA